MNKKFKVLGICISISCLLSLEDPATCFFTLPIVFALGCIVYGLGVMMELLNKPRG